jgi:hypothetical protein
VIYYGCHGLIYRATPRRLECWTSVMHRRQDRLESTKAERLNPHNDACISLEPTACCYLQHQCESSEHQKSSSAM